MEVSEEERSDLRRRLNRLEILVWFNLGALTYDKVPTVAAALGL